MRIKSLCYALIPVSSLFFFLNCNKHVNHEVVTPPVTPIDAGRVTANVSGLILNENNQPLSGATVTCGGKTTQTTSLGVFYFSAVNISGNNGFVTVDKPGYFKGIRSFVTQTNGDNYVKIQLMQKGTVRTVNAATGGAISANGGATITFPANAFTTTSGTAYSGTVNIVTRWIDPTSGNLALIIPGSLRGIDSTGAENALVTFGMLGADLADNNGNKLQLAAGSEATINLPIPPGLAGAAPATIPLWHFNETTARWVQEGTAVKTGSAYIGKVKRFSFWNCDFGFQAVKLSFTAISSNSQVPLTQMRVRITATAGTQISTREEYTNYLGSMAALVPLNQQLKLEIINHCGSIIHTQDIGALSTNTNLGTIVMNPGLYVSVSGNLLNCANGAVSNGYLALSSDVLGTWLVPANANGNVSFAIPVCAIPASASYRYQVTDMSNGQLSGLINGVATGNTITLGSSSACGSTQTSGVYVGGLVHLGSGMHPSPVVWKDGLMEVLGNGTVNGKVWSVAVTDSNWYAGGSIIDTSNYLNYTAAVWKNGSLQVLQGTTTKSEIRAVCADNDNIYAAGYENTSKPAIWKNGVKISDSYQNPSGMYNAISLNGSDFYAAGVKQDNLTSSVGYWKNGVFSSIPNAYTTMAIQVSGGDVYVGGSILVTSAPINRIAAVWKNGNLLYSSPAASTLTVVSMAINGGDVYLAGFTSNFGTVWKNGVPTVVTQGNSGFLRGACSKGDDIYLCGNEYYPFAYSNPTLKYWKNNLPVLLTDQYPKGEAYSIFVK